jgi:Vacuolar protein sorting 55
VASNSSCSAFSFEQTFSQEPIRMQLSILAKIIILSIISAMGLSFLLLGCILPNAYWPLCILLFYVFLPIPILIASGCNRDGDNAGPNELAVFITAILFVSTFGLPVVLYLKDCIQSLGFVFTLTGNIVLISTGIVYALLFHRQSDEFR